MEALNTLILFLATFHPTAVTHTHNVVIIDIVSTHAVVAEM